MEGCTGSTCLKNADGVSACCSIAIDGLLCDCKLYPVFYSGTASVLPGCVECCKVRKVCLLANPNISQRLRVSKYSIEVIANSVRVFSTRSVTRPDWHVKFCQIILQNSRRSYEKLAGKMAKMHFCYG